MALTQITEKGIKDGEIINADINASAAIASSKLAKPIDLADDEKIRLGTGNDLQIYHESNENIIKSTSSGDFKIKTDTTINITKGSSEDIAKFIPDGACELWHDNSKKFETTSSGVTISGGTVANGHITLPDHSGGQDGKLRLGAGADLELYHDGSNSYIDSEVGSLIVRDTGGAERFRCNGYGTTFNDDIILQNDNDKIKLGAGDDLQIYHASSNNYVDIASGQQLYFRVGGSGNTKFYVQSGGAQFIGSLYGDDDNKIELGDNQDLQIYHNGDDSFIKDTGTGGIRIDSNQTVLRNAAGTEHIIETVENGAVKLYYDGTEVFATVSNGIKLQNGGASYLYFYDVNTSTITMYTNSTNLRWYDDVNNDNIMQLTQGGNLNIDGSYSNSGVDYAEYFESTDGSAIAIGTTVVLEDGKVRAATSSETPIGVIRPKTSGTSVTGGVNQLNWQGKYLVDDYDGQVMESAVHCTWTDNNEVNQQCWKDRPPTGVTIPDDAVETTRERPKLNPSFDASKTYVPRSERDEWNCVGLLGQIPITKGQPTSSNWIKMKDKTSTVELWMVK